MTKFRLRTLVVPLVAAVCKRGDGSPQWAYDGKPLYFYTDDQKVGDRNGEGVDGVWHVVK